MCISEVESQGPSDGFTGHIPGCFTYVSLQIVKELWFLPTSVYN